jgi:hypothetical protein
LKAVNLAGLKASQDITGVKVAPSEVRAGVKLRSDFVDREF